MYAVVDLSSLLSSGEEEAEEGEWVHEGAAHSNSSLLLDVGGRQEGHVM